MSDYIENIPFDEIKIGDTASLRHTLQTIDIELFAAMSGDVNPEHMDAEFAKNDMFHKIIVHISRMEAAGIVLGASVPIILTSRGSDELSRKASSAMALVHVRNKAKMLVLKP